MFINFAKQQKDSTKIENLSFMAPENSSVSNKIRQGLARLRSKAKYEDDVRFSRLLSSRPGEQIGEDSSIVEDGNSLVVGFENSNVSKSFLSIEKHAI